MLQRRNATNYWRFGPGEITFQTRVEKIGVERGGVTIVKRVVAASKGGVADSDVFRTRIPLVCISI